MPGDDQIVGIDRGDVDAKCPEEAVGKPAHWRIVDVGNQLALQVPDPPQVFSAVRIHHVITGEVAASAVEDAIRLSEEKYCSVGAMIKQSAEIHTTYEILTPVEAGAK